VVTAADKLHSEVEAAIGPRLGSLFGQMPGCFKVQVMDLFDPSELVPGTGRGAGIADGNFR
jgi:hypothetical protein